MPYNLTTLGLREAVLDAIKAALVASLADLNTTMALAPAITGVTATSGMFHIGDPDMVPADPSVNPFWVTIVGGGKQDGQDMDIDQRQSGPGFWNTFHTNIYFYVHPDSFPGTDAFVQMELRERLRARFSDWLRSDVFNNPSGFKLTLASKEMTTARFDTLDESHITEIRNGYVPKGFGGTVMLFMAHFTHTGKVYGGS